jgi:hypothetical protein
MADDDDVAVAQGSVATALRGRLIMISSPASCEHNAPPARGYSVWIDL